MTDSNTVCVNIKGKIEYLSCRVLDDIVWVFHKKQWVKALRSGKKNKYGEYIFTFDK